MVKQTGSVVAVVVLVSTVVGAQDAQSPQSVRGSNEPQSRVTAPQANATRNEQLLSFTVLLRQAVQNGAQRMAQKARQIMPDAALSLSGPTEVFPMRFDDYGPIFEVRVPGMRPNVPWMYSILNRAPRGGQVRSTNISNQAFDPASAAPAPPPPAPSLDLTVISDPDAAYTREVKNALIEAMLDYSAPLRVGPGEWLTVVAHDSAQPDPQVPTSQTDFHTIKFQIKGADLSEYRDGKISQEDAKKRIKITED